MDIYKTVCTNKAKGILYDLNLLQDKSEKTYSNLNKEDQKILALFDTIETLQKSIEDINDSIKFLTIGR